MLVLIFSSLATFLIDKKKPFRIFGPFKELFKETNGKHWGFCVEKKGESKTQMVEVAKSCCQVTVTKK